MSSFLKIYLWQILSLISGFATLFIVTPFISANDFLYGIYSVVASLSLFLSYADLGFVSAGIKYASESFARNDRNEEIRIISFVTFILFAFVLLIGGVILVFAYDPGLLIKGLSDPSSRHIASLLLLTFSVSCPIVVFQRSLQIIFNIRLKDYMYQRIFTCMNLVKILSSFFFFGNGKYHLVEYFVFSQFCTLVSVLLGFLLARRAFGYDFKSYFSSFKFNKAVYEKTKKLAFNSLFITASWILFYEMDLFVIGKFIGAREVAIFSLCVTIMTLFRSIYGIIYNPFSSKFNHYIGRGELKEFNQTFNKVIEIGLPLSVIPVLILVFTLKSFVFSWVGSGYEALIPITSVMLLSYIPTFIANPTGIALVAYEKIKDLYLTSALLPVIYWLGIIITYQYWGLQAFANFKLVAFVISGIVYSWLALRLFQIDYVRFLKSNLLPLALVVLVLFFTTKYTNSYLPYEKGKKELLVYALYCSAYMAISMVLYYLLSVPFRAMVNQVFTNATKMIRRKS